jgi:hypothetical protein
MTGQTWRTTAHWASYTRGRLEKLGCRVYSPSEVEAPHHDPKLVIGSTEDNQNGHPLAKREAFFHIDKGEVQRADTVFVDLMRARRPSIGADFEMAWAHLLNKLLIVVLKRGGVYDQHPFTHACGAAVFYNLEDAIAWLGYYLRSMGEPAREPPREEE